MRDNPKDRQTLFSGSRKISRRTFMAALGVGAAGVGSGLYGYCETKSLEISRHTVPTGKQGPEIRILHLADLHASNWTSLDVIQDAVKIGLQLKPHMVCITGDFISNVYNRFDDYAKVLSQLSSNMPAFATLGNHDGGHWAGKHGGYPDIKPISRMIEQSGFCLLHNSRKDVRINGRTLALVGLGDYYAKECTPRAEFFAKTDSPIIVLSHNPDTKSKFKSYTWDLLLSGHTHGGQLKLPFLGAPFAPVKDKRFIAGLYNWENRWLHVTKGVGSGLRLRFNCRPEVSLLTLT